MWTKMRTQAVGMAVSVTADEKGVLWQARMQDGHIWVSHSEDQGKHFSEGVKVNAEPEAILAEGQNRPRIVVKNGVIAVVWSQALEKTFAGNIRFSRSLDGGKTFSAPITVNDGPQEIGHSFAAMTMNDKGRVTVLWLDGREKWQAEQKGKSYTGSTLFYAVSDDGAHFSANKKLADHVCECCRVEMVLDNTGVPVAFFRKIFDGSERDFALAPVKEKTSVRRVSEDHWAIDACPHHGGDTVVDSKGSHHLVWFTGNPRHAGLFYRRIDDEHMTKPYAFGHVDAQASYPTVFVHEKLVYVAWREFDGKNYQLWLMYSNDRGQTWSAAQKIAATEGKADLPSFVAGTELALLVWNSAANGVQIFNVTEK
jgi:hypothetical protein